MNPASSARPPGLRAGLAAAASGLRLAARNQQVRRAYALAVFVLWALTSALQVGGLWLLWHLTAPGDEPLGWIALASLWLLRVGGSLLVLLAAPLLALFLVNLALPLLGERIFLAALDVASPPLAAELRARPGRPPWLSMRTSATRLLRFVAATMAATGIGLVPVAGGVLAPALQSYVGAQLLAWELLDPYFDRAGLDEAAIRRLLRRARPALLGFALPYTLAMAIPLAGPFLFGLAQAAAALLTAQVIEPLARAERARDPGRGRR